MDAGQEKPSGNRLVILGSGGARIVVAKQLRASGGLWFSLAGTEFIVDPGPGALVRMTSSRHGLDPARLEGVLISHRHLDHAGDANNIIEAMTLGGTRPGGALFAPDDALEGEDRVILRYLRPTLGRVVALRENGEYELGNVRFRCPVRHKHRGEVYGFRFEVPAQSAGNPPEGEAGLPFSPAHCAGESSGRKRTPHPSSAPPARPPGIGCRGLPGPKAPELTVSCVTDTAYFPELAEHYRADVMVINVVRLEPSDLDHLHLPDAEALIRSARPRLAILNHFGMTMLRARPWELARKLSAATGVKVIAASDDRQVWLEAE